MPSGWVKVFIRRRVRKGRDLVLKKFVRVADMTNKSADCDYSFPYIHLPNCEVGDIYILHRYMHKKPWWWWCHIGK